jgi:hypothetical protein
MIPRLFSADVLIGNEFAFFGSSPVTGEIRAIMVDDPKVSAS